MSLWTVYRVEDGRGEVELIHDAERAERLSRAGLRVTALSESALMTLTEYGYCARCDDRVELVPVTGGEVLACCRCDAVDQVGR